MPTRWQFRLSSWSTKAGPSPRPSPRSRSPMAARSRMESPLRHRDTGAPAGTAAEAAPARHAPAQPDRSSASGPAAERVAERVASPLLPLRPLTGWEEEYLEPHQYDANTARLC